MNLHDLLQVYLIKRTQNNDLYLYKYLIQTFQLFHWIHRFSTARTPCTHVAQTLFEKYRFKKDYLK